MSGPAPTSSRETGEVSLPIFARPSERSVQLKRLRYGWAKPLGWTLLAAAAGLTVAAAAWGRVSLFGAVVVVVVLAGSRPLLARFARNEHGLDLESLFRVGLGLKLLAVLPRYELRQDASDYHVVGRALAGAFRRLDFFVETGRSVPGTGSVRYVSGLVHVVTFDDEFATFVIFALAGYIGLLFFVRAFVRGLPAVDPGRYVALLMCWPSLAYWPASTGKEALMIFGLGLAAYGLARLLCGHWQASILLGAGVVTCALVRPHVALIVVIAGLGAAVMNSRGEITGGVLTRFVLLGGLVGVGVLSSGAVEQLFDIQDLNISTVDAALDLANSRSSQGGSSFTAARIDSVADVPWGVVTVVMRPLPHEAATFVGFVAAAEGLVLGVLLLGAVPRFVAELRTLRSEAYVAYAIVFVGIFTYLFSALGNFGILTRQRTMVTPLLLVVVALPTAYERVRNRRLDRSLRR